VLATFARECSRKVSKAFVLETEVERRDLLCARKDSRPLLKAKEPRGRAESESRRRAWRVGLVMAASLLDGRERRLEDVLR